MIYNLKTVRKQIFGLPLSEANFKVRGFKEGTEAQPRLELVAKTVVNGYNVAVENGLNDDLKAITKTLDKELVGFFNEGVGMGLYTLDLFSLTNKKRFWDFIKGTGSKHEYMAYIGAGLACGVFKRPFEKFMDKACPMSGCLVLDGIGFYYAMFKTKRTLDRKFVPKIVQNNSFYQERYDNGIGRAVWFYAAGEPERIAHTIQGFRPERRGAIWSGIGLAATYAGGVNHDKLLFLKELADEHEIMLAQGSFLATHTRHRAGNPHLDDQTEKILIGKRGLECHNFANQIRQTLEGKRIVEGKPSFQVFLETVRTWIRQSGGSRINGHSLRAKLNMT